MQTKKDSKKIMAIIYGRADSEKQLDKYPNQVQALEDIDKIHQELRKEIKETFDAGVSGGIKKRNKKPQINKFEKNKDDPLHAGTSGELNTLDVLKKLPDEYHVLCGVSLALPNYITYNGKKNLKSAQMDFVVVSKRGVILLEVENWSTSYYNKNENLSSHEQVDRAAQVLRITLKSWRNPSNPAVKSVVLATRGNMKYDPRYKFVSVSNLDKINSFLQNREEEFSEKEVKRVVGRLNGHVTR